GFADDLAPPGALVAVRAPGGEWAVGDSLAAARAASAKVQGRRTTAELSWPVALPAGDWDLTLQTTWVEPAYLEPDASWCEPGGTPASPFGNAGAFGAKRRSAGGEDAARPAAAHGATVAARWTREAVVLRGVKRPP